jgi:hypothetical protein
MTITNKQLLISESHGNLNRCTPCRGKLDQHATHFPRLVRVWSKTICFSRGSHIATFRTVVNKFEQIHCSWEEGLLTTLSLAEWSAGPYPASLPNQPLKQWGKPSFCWQPTTRFTRPTNTSMWSVCSILAHRGNSSVLNGHMQDYSLEGASFPHTTPRPVSNLTKFYQLNRRFEFKNLWPPRGLSTTQPSTVAYIYA